MTKQSKAGFAVTLMALVAATAGSAAQPASSPRMTPGEQQNLKLVNEWIRVVIQAGHVELVEKYMTPDYIQHDPVISTGREAFVKDFGGRPPTEPLPETAPMPSRVLTFAKGPYVFGVFDREAKDQSGATYPYTSFDLFRVENGKVAEHWGGRPTFREVPLTEPVVPGVGPRPLKPRNSAEEQRTEDIATVLFKDILQYGHLELAEKVIAPGYIQHNPNVPTGRKGFVEFFSRFAKPEPIRAQWKDEPELIITSGNIVVYMFKRFSADPSDPSQIYKWNWFDVVRVENGMIQEHWDSAKKIPVPAVVAKPAGYREYR